MLRIVLLVALATAIPVLAHAQSHPAAVGKAKPPARAATADDMPKGPKAFVGAWVIGQDGEGADTCTVRFNAAGVIGGFQLVAPKTCKGVIAHWDDLYAWRIGANDDIVLADAMRRAMLVFHKLDADVWATEGGNWDRLLLQRESRVGLSR
jgi:hypothetical protein